MTKSTNAPIIYKICDRALWREAERQGVFKGSAVDLHDGYIHFSDAGTVAETAARHFAGQDNLLLISVAGGHLGAALKRETSRGGARFPHLYGDLPLKAVLKVEPLSLDDSGMHVFPPLLR